MMRGKLVLGAALALGLALAANAPQIAEAAMCGGGGQGRVSGGQG